MCLASDRSIVSIIIYCSLHFPLIYHQCVSMSSEQSWWSTTRGTTWPVCEALLPSSGGRGTDSFSSVVWACAALTGPSLSQSIYHDQYTVSFLKNGLLNDHTVITTRTTLRVRHNMGLYMSKLTVSLYILVFLLSCKLILWTCIGKFSLNIKLNLS